MSLPGLSSSEDFAVSQDGHRIVYSARTNGTSSLWERDINSAEPRMLPGTEGARFPDWYGDGRSIVFATAGEVQLIDLSGNGRRELSNLVGDYGRSTSNGSGVILFGDDIGIQCIRWPSLWPQPEPCEPMGRGAPDKSLNETYHRAPWFLPDGRHFLFQAGSTTPGNRAVYIGDLDSPLKKRLVTSESKAIYVAPGFLLFLNGAILMARPFDADRLEFTGDAVAVANNAGGFYASSGTLVYLIGKSLNASTAPRIQVVLNWANAVDRKK
jgi:eukaryotic-like serine/threonine-protein kinase